MGRSTRRPAPCRRQRLKRHGTTIFALDVRAEAAHAATLAEQIEEALDAAQWLRA
jgi:hypothetical protein